MMNRPGGDGEQGASGAVKEKQIRFVANSIKKESNKQL
jgi:hypothetical protein